MLIRLKVRVIPNARKNEVVACTGDEIRLKVKAPAVDGKANAALIEYLSELANVSRSRVAIMVACAAAAARRFLALKERSVPHDFKRRLKLRVMREPRPTGLLSARH
jgi:uncharacterized protein (TIGR00251 family)